MDLNPKVEKARFRRVMAGKTSDRVASTSRGPGPITAEPHPASRAAVLGLGETEGRERRAILVATDGSGVALRAGEYAARLAGGLGARLFALYVVDEHATFHAGIHYGEFVERLSEDGREATGKVRALAEEAGAECEELVVLGRPDRTILEVADELGADPIVLGAEGVSKLEHALVGSVSEEVLRHADRTVLVVGGHPMAGPPGRG